MRKLTRKAIRYLLEIMGLKSPAPMDARVKRMRAKQQGMSLKDYLTQE